MERSQALPTATLADLRSALEAARAAVEDETKDAALAGRLQALADGLDASGDEAERIAALKDVLEAVATTLR